MARLDRVAAWPGPRNDCCEGQARTGRARRSGDRGCARTLRRDALTETAATTSLLLCSAQNSLDFATAAPILCSAASEVSHGRQPKQDQRRSREGFRCRGREEGCRLDQRAEGREGRHRRTGCAGRNRGNCQGSQAQAGENQAFRRRRQGQEEARRQAGRCQESRIAQQAASAKKAKPAAKTRCEARYQDPPISQQGNHHGYR